MHHNTQKQQSLDIPPQAFRGIKDGNELKMVWVLAVHNRQFAQSTAQGRSQQQAGESYEEYQSEGVD